MSRAVDQSMDLLKQIMEQPVDPDYAEAAAAQPDPKQRSSWSSRLVFGLAVLVIAAMVAAATVHTSQARPAIEHEREQLVTRIKTAEDNRDRLRERVDQVAAENARLRTAGLGNDASDQELRDQLAELETATGAAPMTGAGVRIVVDDANPQTRVLDVDLQMLANGLWDAGAEAIQINGQRLTSRTAIREAGQAITVNYRSLNPPYVVEAVGDPTTLPPRLLETSAGAWWNALKHNQGMRYEVTAAEELKLSGVPGLTVRTGRTR
jgi:uncharacterized protein YlxW (UPF0749 family)